MSTTVPISTAPTVIYSPQAHTSTAIITNAGTSTVFLGQSGVTAATGLPLVAGQTIQLLDTTVSLYAVSGLASVASPTDTLSADASASGTALTVASGGASFTAGMVVFIEDGNSSEIVTVGAGSTGTSVVVSALQFDHATGVKFGQLAQSAGGVVTVVSGT